MKNKISYLSLLICVTYLLLTACTKIDWQVTEKLKPGFGVFYDSSSFSVLLTKDMYANTVDYSPLEIDLRFFYSLQMKSITEAGILKSLQDENGATIETVSQLKFTDLSDTIKINITNKEQLFEGMSFNPDSIQSGYSFVFKPYVVTSELDTVFAAYGSYAVTPEYVNFCEIPEFPLGVYEAYNKETGFKKDVEVRYIEVIPNVWFYVFTDFGLDWSTWNDFWYGTNFSLTCPQKGDTRFVVEFAAWGIDLSKIVLTMKDDLGVMKSRPLRIMPWTYDAESPDVGYYDAENKQFIFKNVKVKDTWWNLDNHLIKDVTFTYKGK